MLARLIAWFFVGIIYAIGPVLLLIAIVVSIPTVEFVTASLATNGEVTSLEPVLSRRHTGYVYLPVFEFTANDGQRHWVRAESNASFVPFKRGDRVRVLYLKDHPETARIESIPQLWMAQVILAFFGVLFTAFAWRMFKRKTTTMQSGRVTITYQA